MAISERLTHLIELEKNQAEFSKKTGLGRGTISQIVNGNRNMSSATMELVLIAYPKLNARWFILGEGSPWEDDYKEKSISLERKVEALLEELEQKNNVIKNLNTFSEYLHKENEKLIKELKL
jgi:transcriptional regulator with XRE-family HTH domain